MISRFADIFLPISLPALNRLNSSCFAVDRFRRRQRREPKRQVYRSPSNRSNLRPFLLDRTCGRASYLCEGGKGYGMSRRSREAISMKPRRGFSLVETLVVVAIISILMALYLPVLSKA